MGYGLVSERACNIDRFYGLLARLEERVDGKRSLADCDGQEGWPQGVYFFFERGEYRSDNDGQMRVVRVGTHGATPDSPSTLWWRLTQHKNDVGRSVFRDHLDKALLNRSGADKQAHNHQSCVSKYIGKMPFLWINVDGDEGHKRRAEIERNSIGLLSFWRNDSIGRPSDEWLGNHRKHKLKKVERSGLWNVTYVTRSYDSAFLDDLERCVDNTQRLQRRADDWDLAVCLD